MEFNYINRCFILGEVVFILGISCEFSRCFLMVFIILSRVRELVILKAQVNIFRVDSFQAIQIYELEK